MDIPYVPGLPERWKKAVIVVVLLTAVVGSIEILVGIINGLRDPSSDIAAISKEDLRSLCEHAKRIKMGTTEIECWNSNLQKKFPP